VYTKKWVKACPFAGVSPFLSASSNHLFAISSLLLFSICLYLAPIRSAEIPGGAILSLKSASLAPAKSLPSNTLRTLALLLSLFFQPRSFIFNHLRTLFGKHRGWGGSIASGTDREGTPDETIPASVYAAQLLAQPPEPSGSCYNFRSS